MSPKSWQEGIQAEKKLDNGIPFQHVGALFPEFQFQRYQARTKLSKILRSFDLVQVVAGHPAWGLVTSGIDCPVALQVATLARVERSMKIAEGGGLLGMWRVLMTKITDRLDQEALREMDVVLVENEWMLEHVEQKAPCTEVIFCPPGIDTSQFTPSGTPFDERDYILSVGRFGDPRKNPELLFQAYANLRECLGDTTPRLVLAGRTAPSPEAWELAEDLGVRDKITFHEDISTDRLSSLYREAKLFVLSSDEEGLGLVILEAMASGIPVVSTDCGGPATAVKPGETGTLVPTGDPSAMCEAMKTLLQSPPKLERFGERARQRTETVFSQKATGTRFLKVYDQLLDKRNE
ncbi:glycosyltransferase involved in cell wall biosynthesis [Salinibacter ruber]|uniref:glycosyltransferase family 4 protein n=1 Tax=Salinibacter ruber TaxID=146919 RepID=UPI002169BFFD|nr:glycosyltransferase family 4 protein [Salinibacter ruber]MCS3753157.1 glycosyltransferase involved in cell wall biosynthesis [Salinibacter ruber]